MRVAQIAKLLGQDGVKPHQYPQDGRVRSFLTNDKHVHDPRDEPDIIDWCVEVGASQLLSCLLPGWERKSVYFQKAVADVLEAAIPAALAGGAQHIAVVRSLPNPDVNCFGSPKLVGGLVEAAAWCESLTLQDFGLLTSAELHRFLDFSRGRCALKDLSLCQVTGMDSEAMNLLARLMSSSTIQTLHLGEVDPCLVIDFLKALHRWTTDASFQFLFLEKLDFTYAIAGDAAGRKTAEGERQIEEINLQIVLLKSMHQGLTIIPKRFVVVPELGRSGRGTLPPDHFSSGITLTLQPRLPGTPPTGMVELHSADTHEPLWQAPARTGIEWNPRVLGSPGFLLDIAQGLNQRWQAEESTPTRVMRNRSMVVAEKDISRRIALYLAEDGEPAKLSWIRALNEDHRGLWDSTYARHLEALAREDMPTMKEMDALLRAGKTFDLIGYVQQLRERDQLPPPKEIDALRSRYVKHPGLKEIWLWAFHPVGAIEHLITEGRADELPGWSNTLRQVGALPPFEDLAPLISRCLDEGLHGLVEQLWRFQA